MVEVVGDEDHRKSAALGLADVIEDLARLLDGEGGGGLVQDDQLGPEMHRPTDGDGLALAAGEHAHVLRRRTQRGDPDLAPRLLGPPVHRGARASLGEPRCAGRPSKKSWPLSGGCTPLMILISVDLPPPLSPTRPTTSW